ncbi:MAG: S-adenosylmethionine:tRNA ribosyltransferase-isomerase, partial [bacterium]|nr:S-adenosylmethionine:tRNA ribosyltransferase-isomerase [bacterium]
YQTVYAKVRGAVAAPTAGLHFTNKILEKISKKGVKIAPVVLHLGLGSFRPVIVEDLGRHKMDSEYYEITAESASIINDSIKKRGDVFAVGTSSVRVLESVVTTEGFVKPAKGWTDKFIYPPYDFKVVDHMITNFHLPCSTLIMLASAFAGRDFLFRAYDEAVKEKWRFFSYGDVMLIL